MNRGSERTEIQPNPNLQIVTSIDAILKSKFAVQRYRNIYDPSYNAFLLRADNAHAAPILSLLPDNFKRSDLYQIAILHDDVIDKDCFFDQEGNGIKQNRSQEKDTNQLSSTSLTPDDYEEVFEVLRQIKDGNMIKV